MGAKGTHSVGTSLAQASAESVDLLNVLLRISSGCRTRVGGSRYTSSPWSCAAHSAGAPSEFLSLKGDGGKGEQIFFAGLLGCRHRREGDVRGSSHLTLSSILGGGCQDSHCRDEDADSGALLVQEHTARQGQGSTQAEPELTILLAVIRDDLTGQQLSL